MSIADLGAGLLMAAGHRNLARRVVELSGVGASDRALDIGCGPGNAVREAGRLGADVIGVDPASAMLRVARWLTRRHPGRARISFESGTAEALPLADGTVSVAWTIASFHHWSDPVVGLAEARRVLGADGRMLVVERLVGHGRGWHTQHGLTESRAAEVAGQLRGAGFADVGTETVPVGRGTYVVIRGVASSVD